MTLAFLGARGDPRAGPGSLISWVSSTHLCHRSGDRKEMAFGGPWWSFSLLFCPACPAVGHQAEGRCSHAEPGTVALPHPTPAPAHAECVSPAQLLRGEV